MPDKPTTRSQAVYGTSTLDGAGTPAVTFTESADKSLKPRRDSTAPLMYAPPTGSTPFSLNSSPLHTAYDTSPDVRHRRRTRRESNNSLVTDDTEISASDDYISDSGSSNAESQARDETPLAHSADVRIGGFDEAPEDPWKQTLLLVEEDVHITIEGYRHSPVRRLGYQLLCILSAGFVWVVCRWIPTLWISWVGEKVALKDASWLVFTNQFGEREIVRPIRENCHITIDSVFSAEQMKRETTKMALDPDTARQLASPGTRLGTLILADYRYVRLAYHPLLRKFLVTGFWRDPTWTMAKNVRSGLTSEKHLERLLVFGPNLISIKEKPTGKLLIDEVLNPFYVFQIGSIILWSLDDYYYYAFCIFLISAISILSTLVETKQTMKRMRDMSRFDCAVRVFRSGSWRSVSSSELTPGDLIDITDLHTLPCDAMLISGDCIVNESMLTGESVPVSKIPVTDAILRKMDLSASTLPAEITKHFLFNGTKVVRVRNISNVSAASAVVVRTGFNTAKGALIRSMLFPKPNNFQFYRDSFRFIGVLSIIAVFGFLLSSINFVRLGIDSTTMILRALDLITIVVPPALPATMSIGTSFAINRLKKVGIFCISPPRVNIGGKVDCMCFDKTGTLTEDGLDIHGIRSVSMHGDGRRLFDEEIRTIADTDANDNESMSTKSHILRTMTTCHSLKIVGGELLGDPLDLKMFEFTGWELEESGGASSTGLKPRSELAALRAKKNSKVGIMPTVVRPPGGRQDLSLQITNRVTPPVEFGIIHTFEFVSALRRMSVIVRRLANPSMEVLVKGAPEVMKDICQPESMPEDYKERLYWYTHRGYRVIACAYRQLDGVKWHKLHKLKRQEVESNLTFLGFIIFENKLKERTIPAITTLRNADIRQIMCTGDNILTAVSVSRECGLVDQAAEIYIPRFLRGSSTDPDSQIVWESVLHEGDTLSGETLLPVRPLADRYDHPYGDRPMYYMAVSGEAFRWMVDHAPTDVLHRMLVKGAIYARMSPDEKQELVVELQNIGYCVGFCGDGANDCGALKAGDVGISLSEAEASVAAPFTSSTMDIECVIDVIKEGRAALVTSFGCFKYMALYSIIQFTSVTLLYAFGSNLGDFQFLYIDLFLILPIAVYMGYTGAWPYLYRKRPTASLVSKKVLTSLIGQIVIMSGFQFVAYWAVHQQAWYTAPVFDPDGENIQCLENTVLFLLSSFQYILVAVVFSVGPPYRKPLWSNGRLVLTLAVLVTLTVWCVLYPTKWMIAMLELERIPASFRVFIVVLAAANLCVSLASEKYLFEKLAGWLSQGVKGARGGPHGGYAPAGKAHRKMYKQVMEEMGITSGARAL